MAASESTTRREAKRQGYLWRRNRTRNRRDDQYGLYVLVDDTAGNRRPGAQAARSAFWQGEGDMLDAIADKLRLNNLRREALYQGLRLIVHSDGTYSLGSSRVWLRYRENLDEVAEYLYNDEHCVRCNADHDDHTTPCRWCWVHDYLVCPACLTDEEFHMRELAR